MSRRFWASLALGAILLSGGDAKAGFIAYLATGSFDSGLASGTPTFLSPTDPSTSVTYTNPGVQTVTVPPLTNIGLGTLTVASLADPSAPTAVFGNFTLVIENTATMDTISFVATLNGSVSSSTSTAYLLFSGPLSQNLDGFLFSISSADDMVAGRVNLAAPTTNGGVTTINGTVTAAAVPEPSSIALLGIGAPALLGLALRRRSKAARV